MSFFILTKKIIKRVLPKPILEYLLRRHYFRVVKNFNANKELDLNVIRHLVNPNETVIDVGANIGVYTKFLSEYVGVNGTVYAYEPIKITYSFLNNNIKLLNLKNVFCFNQALSDKIGKAIMEIPDIIAGQNYFRARIINKNNPANSEDTHQVDCTTLDEVVSHFKSKISFIKCDVEGHELSVLEGSYKTLVQQRPSLLIEINEDPRFDQNAKSVFDILLGLNYKSFWFDGEILRQYSHGDKCINYFFLLDEHLQQLSKTNLKIN